MDMRWVLCAVLACLGCASGPPEYGAARELRQGARVGSALTWQGRAGRKTPRLDSERQAAREAMGEVERSLDAIARVLTRLGDRDVGIGGHGGAFQLFVDPGPRQVAWGRGLLREASVLMDASEEAEDADLERGLLQMAGLRLEAGMAGVRVLAAWLDVLQLGDAVLEQCPFYSAEQVMVDLARVQGRMEFMLGHLSSLEPAQVGAASDLLPGWVGEFTREFLALREGAQVAAKRAGRVVAVARFLEMITLVSSLNASLSRMPPAAPVTLGTGLVMGSGGVMMGTRVVVSTEWVERMRRLVQAGVITAPVVSAAVRIQAGQMLMVRGGDELPEAVRDALGEGPEVRGMRVAGRAGAGMAAAPRHHVLPKEHREWFEKRGFKGGMDIDSFCVRLERSHHEAVHGGGDWRLGRTWPGEWNRLIMKALREAEIEKGKRLTQTEVLAIVADRMKIYDIPMRFVRGSSR
jgi:hypothetical protein